MLFTKKRHFKKNYVFNKTLIACHSKKLKLLETFNFQENK